jgi:hypothetical protein
MIAIEVWNSVSSSRLFLSLGSEVDTAAADLRSFNFSHRNIVVACSKDFSVDIGGGCDSICLDQVAAVGSTRPAGDHLEKGFVIINMNDSALGKFSEQTALFRKIAITHEFGHALGLGHTNYNPSLMYYALGSKEKLNLSQDDIDGITYLYPRNETGEQLPFGCGTLALPTSSLPPWLTLLLLPLLLLIFFRRQGYKGLAHQ